MRRLIPALTAWLRNPEIRVTVTPSKELESLRAEVAALKSEKGRTDPQLTGARSLYYEAINTNRRLIAENELLREQIQKYERELRIQGDFPSYAGNDAVSSGNEKIVKIGEK